MSHMLCERCAQNAMGFSEWVVHVQLVTPKKTVEGVMFEFDLKKQPEVYWKMQITEWSEKNMLRTEGIG